MIERVEIAVSKRSYCFKCKKRIAKAEVRGIDLLNRFYCNKCINFTDIKKEIREIEKEFKRLSKLTEEERNNMLIKQKVMNRLR